MQVWELRWRHNELDGVSDHQPHDCLLNRLFGRRSKKTSKLRVNSPHKRPVTRKMFPFDDVIILCTDGSGYFFTNVTFSAVTEIGIRGEFLAATKQLYEWYFPSVCPSVTPFWLCSHQRIILKFSGVVTNDKSDVHAKGQRQRSKVKVTGVTTQLNRFRTVTPVWNPMWWWNDAYSLMMLRRGALLFLKVIRQISRSHGAKKRWIWPRLGVSGL